MKNIYLLYYICLLSSIGCTSMPSPLPPTPCEKQVKWQQMETCALVNLDLKAYQALKEKKTKSCMFQSLNLDCEQWVRTFKEAGMKGVILMAKYNDGFCLWPSVYTNYTIKQTNWKSGKGDIVQELSESCRKYGLKFGLSLSLYDNHKYAYNTIEYVEYYQNQIEELFQNYGPLFELRLDGTKGDESENRISPCLNAIIKAIEKTHKETIIFSNNGPGSRWIGNNEGIAGETNWSFLHDAEQLPKQDNLKELKFGHPDGNQWIPAECNVSLCSNSFCCLSNDSLIKSIETLTDIYYKSVGHNANLLIGFRIDSTGRINVIDSTQIVKWHQTIKRELNKNLLTHLKPEASNIREGLYAPENVTDQDYNSYWATTDGTDSASLTFKFNVPLLINCILMQEYIPIGQRIQKFALEARVDGKWQSVNTGEEMTTIGYKRILRFEALKIEELRILFLESRGPICINTVSAYYTNTDK